MKDWTIGNHFKLCFMLGENKRVGIWLDHVRVMWPDDYKGKTIIIQIWTFITFVSIAWDRKL